MGKYYCDYCDVRTHRPPLSRRMLTSTIIGQVFLTHDSSSVRRAHNSGRNHLSNVRDYYASELVLELDAPDRQDSSLTAPSFTARPRQRPGTGAD